MEELVTYIVKELVSKPEFVEVSTKQENNLNIIQVKTDKDDLGRVIGRNGKIVNSIRTIVKSLAGKAGKKYVIKIGE